MPRWPKTTHAERLAARYVESDGCWEWIAATDRDGYGRDDSAMAHRSVYEELVGPIPPGMELDHLCRNRPCVNPAHLEVVTRAENNRRRWEAKTSCINSHELSGDNLRIYLHPDGHRVRICRTCVRVRAAAYRAKGRAA